LNGRLVEGVASLKPIIAY